MIATIAVIAAIAEKKSSAIAEIIAIIRKPLSSDPAIAATTIELLLSQRPSSLRSLKSGFHMIAMIVAIAEPFFFSAAVVVIIWKPGFKVETVALGNKIGRS